MSRDILAGITEGELRSHLESHTSLECQDCRIHAKARYRDSKQPHEAREIAGGRFVKSATCDGCGKPCGTEPLCDDEALTDGSDGPGFFLCERKRCRARCNALPVEERRAHYLAQRIASGVRAP